MHQARGIPEESVPECHVDLRLKSQMITNVNGTVCPYSAKGWNITIARLRIPSGAVSWSRFSFNGWPSSFVASNRASSQPTPSPRQGFLSQGRENHTHLGDLISAATPYLRPAHVRDLFELFSIASSSPTIGGIHAHANWGSGLLSSTCEPGFPSPSYKPLQAHLVQIHTSRQTIPPAFETWCNEP